MISVELVVDAHAELGEGPLWDERAGVVWWVDMPTGRLHRFNPATATDQVTETGEYLAAVMPRAKGGLILATERGLCAWPAPNAANCGPSFLAPVDPGRPDVRPNDCAVDPTGRLWLSTARDEVPRRDTALWRVESDFSMTCVSDDLSLGNGIAWSPTGDTMYVADSTERLVYAYEFDPDSGTARERRTFVRAAEPDGMPDGLAVDAAGGVWVAYWDGWCVRRYAPDGTLDEVVRFPVAQVTSCAFGGPELDDLYVTTAAEGAHDDQPHAGGLFRAKPEVRGLRTPAFSG